MKKPTLKQFEILELLMENANCAFSIAAIYPHSSVDIIDKRTGQTVHIERDGKRFDPRLIRSTTIHALWEKSYIYKVDKSKLEERLKEAGERSYWSWFDNPYVLTNEGRAAYVEFKEYFDEQRKKEKERKAKLERFIIVGIHPKWGKREAGIRRNIGVLCKVLDENEKTLHVEVIRSYDGEQGAFGFLLTRKRGKILCNKNDVVLDNVTEEKFDKLVKHEDDKFAKYKELINQKNAEIEPIENRFRQRKQQLDAMFEDEFNNIVEG